MQYVVLVFSPFFSLQVQESTYQDTIHHINGVFEEAEGLNCRNYAEGCLACLTGYTIHYCFKTNYERVSACLFIVLLKLSLLKCVRVFI